MPLQLFNLETFRRLTKDLPGDAVIILEGEDFTYYEQNCNGIRFFPASLGAPPAIVLEPGQEVTEDHYLLARLDAYLQNDIGTFLRDETT